MRHSHPCLVTPLLVAAMALACPPRVQSHPVFPGDDRLDALFIGPPHSYEGNSAAECTLLESLTDIRFSVVPIPFDAGDHMADVDGHFGKDPKWIPIRKAEILRQLRLPHDAVILAAGVDDPEIQDALARHMTEGGALVWLAGDKAPDWLSALIGTEQETTERAANPLAGLGLEQAGIKLANRKAAALTDGLTVLHALRDRKTAIPLVTCARVGRWSLLSIASLRGSMFPVSFTPGIDGDWLWAQAFERLVRFAIRGTTEPVVVVEASPAEPDAAPALDETYRITLTGPKGVTVRLHQSDMHGHARDVGKVVKLSGDPVTVDATLSHVPGGMLMIEATPSSADVAGGMTFVSLPAPVEPDLFTTRQGNLPDFATESTLRLTPRSDFGKVVLHWTVLDWARKTVAYRAEELRLDAGKTVERTLEYTLADPDSRAYISWLQACVIDANRRVLARAETPLYRYRPYDLTEQVLVATWHTSSISSRPGAADLLADYLHDVGFNAVFDFRDRDVLERHNFRQYMEHQGTTRMGIGHAAPFRADIEGYAERYRNEGRRRAGIKDGFGEPGYRGPWPSAALNLFSMGEETGFGPWSQSYPWRKEEAAPEECNKWFRHYLQQLYGNDLARLNQAWGRNFGAWDEIKVWRKYAEPFGWMFVPPPEDPEENLTPYVDTHAFHEWYVHEYCANYMKGYAAANPVTTWTMSYDFTFLQFCPAPMTNFWHALAPEGLSLWHSYVRSRTPGPANPFHLDWMFFEDERMNNQFLQLGLAAGCTYVSTWGPMFNGDLTPSRSTLAITKTMKQVERPEAIVRKMTPHTNPRVGIFTLDSRWALVRGRYGFYMQRNGPYDVTMGKGPYQAPGASYVKPPELPLYRALSTSGYAPRYVLPDQIKDCKVLFLPYVEAIDTATADTIRQYVEDGGALVVFPAIAQYDEGGKPYPRYPGAGFDQLLGFTADPDWLMGRSQVEFPGENAARKAFEDAWLLGDKDSRPAEDGTGIEPPLYFDLGMRIGGHPCHYMPEGRQHLTNLAKDVAVIGHHQDGNPLLTYRKVGKGAAICFNVLLTGGSGLAEPATEATETFRQVIEQLMRRFGVTPDVEFFNTRSYGEGVSDFVTMQYDLPGTDARILTLFGDYRGRTADARLRLHAPFTDVYDVLTGEKQVTVVDPVEQTPETIVVVEPGYWHVLALTTGPVPGPTLSAPRAAQLGETASLSVGPSTDSVRYGRLDVYGPDGNRLGHHCRSVVLQPGETLPLQLRLDDPLKNTTGETVPWTVRYSDAMTGESAQVTIDVRTSHFSEELANAAMPAQGESLSRTLIRRGPELTDDEFLALLIRLRENHLDPEPVDKRRYSFYTYEMGDSRQRTMQLLAATDWTTRLDILADFLATGERLYLVGEDLGFDAASGVSTTPGRHPHILPALQQLAGRRRTDVSGVSGKPYLRVLKVGKGMLVLDRRSPDASGNSNLHLAAYQLAWRKEIASCGLAPGGTGTTFLSVDEETLDQWFFGSDGRRARLPVQAP